MKCTPLFAILCSAILLLIFSCNKPDNSNHATLQPDKDTLRFEVLNFGDFSMKQTDTLPLLLSVHYVGGKKEAVALSLSGFPSGVVFSIIPQIDTPDFNTVITFFAQHAKAGDYPLTLLASTSRFSKAYSAVMHLDSIPANPAAALVGNYNETGNCSSGSKNHPVRISLEASGLYNKIVIEKFWSPSGIYTINADLSPVAKTLSIPAQTSGGLTFSGSGSYTDTTLTVHYSVKDGGFVNDSCNTVLKRL